MFGYRFNLIAPVAIIDRSLIIIVLELFDDSLDELLEAMKLDNPQKVVDAIVKVIMKHAESVPRPFLDELIETMNSVCPDETKEASCETIDDWNTHLDSLDKILKEQPESETEEPSKKATKRNRNRTGAKKRKLRAAAGSAAD